MSAPSKGRALRLVIADDEPDTVETLAAILSDEGHSVARATSGPGVLAEIKRDLPDAIIVDIGMPDISGLAVAREAKRIFGQATPLMIAISGIFVGESDRMLTELAGFDHFLHKPCDARQVLALLEPLTARPRPPAPDFSATMGR